MQDGKRHISKSDSTQILLPIRMIEVEVQRKVRTAFRRQAKLVGDVDIAFSSDGAVLSQILDFGVGAGGWPIGAAVGRLN